ncbi:hypothetical protein ACVNIS_06480 [Sphaerotilaceae bacterium SBD11-9]
MKQITKYFWRLTSERTGRPYTTRYRMSIDEARERGEVGEPLEFDKLVIDVGETEEEIDHLRSSPRRQR